MISQLASSGKNLFFLKGTLFLAPVLLVLSFIAGCGKDPGRPNVLLISLDACRADHLGSYGYQRDTSPFLDELAGKGVLYRNAFINTLGTAPSHTSLLSSTFQEYHRVDYHHEAGEKYSVGSIPDYVVMLQEILKENGYFNLALTGGGFFHRKLGFGKGFDIFRTKQLDARRGANKFLKLIEKHRAEEKPVFALFHTYEIHSPYQPPPPHKGLFRKPLVTPDLNGEPRADFKKAENDTMREEIRHQLVARYDEEIRYTDTTLKRLFKKLEEIGFFKNYIVVITSDHGEEFGDHGNFFHSGYLFEELMRVPLIIAGSGIEEGRIEEGMASSIDVAPTILDYIGIPPPPSMRGRSLLKSDSGAGNRTVFAQFRDRRYAARTMEWKLIEESDPDTVALYNIKRDPGEKEDLSAVHPDITAAMQKEIDDFRRQNQPPAGEGETIELDEEHIKNLKTLGYLK